MSTSESALRPRAPRKNLFLAASIRSGALSTAVRIRNLSETGALIEAPVLPNVGERLRLLRSEVEIEGVVVWRSGNRGGIRFEGRVSINDWIAGQNTPVHIDQFRVDELQRRVRAGEAVAQAQLPTKSVGQGPALEARIADEIGYVERLLAAVGEGLVDDPILLQRHATALQNFDIACQILRHLKDVIVADDKPTAIERVALTDLRLRLARKALF